MAIAAYYGLLLAFYLSAYEWDASVFIAAGEDFTQVDDIYVQPLSGYDGQFYYRLALDPLTDRQTDHGIRLDNPPYRQQRILYPALSWLLGRVLPVPWALLLINYAALLAVAWLGALNAVQRGRVPEYGLLFALWPGFLISLTRDLTEPLGAALLLAALLVPRRPWLSAALLSLATLAREVALLAFLALPLPAALLPVAVYGLWQAFLWMRWGQLPVLSGSVTLAWPPYLLTGMPWTVVLPIAAFAALVLVKRSNWRTLKFTWVGYLILILLTSHLIWAEPYAYLRALTEFYLVGVLLLLGDPNGGHEPG